MKTKQNPGREFLSCIMQLSVRMQAGGERGSHAPKSWQHLQLEQEEAHQYFSFTRCVWWFHTGWRGKEERRMLRFSYRLECWHWLSAPIKVRPRESRVTPSVQVNFGGALEDGGPNTLTQKQMSTLEWPKWMQVYAFPSLWETSGDSISQPDTRC